MKMTLALIGILLLISFGPGLIIMGLLYYFLAGVLADVFDPRGEYRSGSGSDHPEYGYDASDGWHGTGNPYI